ncbi:conserved hypothetical protein [delta proteobacterium NaphS2]|nr:conserved hypothetical protein [delta proteobacterium NaphS2]
MAWDLLKKVFSFGGSIRDVHCRALRRVYIKRVVWWIAL